MPRFIRHTLTRAARACHPFTFGWRWRPDGVETFDGRFRLLWADGQIVFQRIGDE